MKDFPPGITTMDDGSVELYLIGEFDDSPEAREYGDGAFLSLRFRWNVDRRGRDWEPWSRGESYEGDRRRLRLFRRHSYRRPILGCRRIDGDCLCTSGGAYIPLCPYRTHAVTGEERGSLYAMCYDSEGQYDSVESLRL